MGGRGSVDSFWNDTDRYLDIFSGDGGGERRNTSLGDEGQFFKVKCFIGTWSYTVASVYCP